MKEPILVINCGSSSIKYALISREDGQGDKQDAGEARLEGIAEQLGSEEAQLKYTDSLGAKQRRSLPEADHTAALEAIFEQLGEQLPVAVGHRIVHGGERFTQAAIIDEGVIEAIRETSALAPLHNPANLAGIEATRRIFPDLPQVAVFDTAFHQSLPPHAYRYALPESLYQQHAIRRYGFHGTSHAYISQTADALNPGRENGWLTAHLGNGCSTCAVWAGRSLDTSMGLTPLAGVVMGTRSGDVDPGLHAHLARQLGWSLEEIDTMLNKKSGLLGLSGLSNDMRQIESAAEQGHAGALLAIAVFCYQIAKSLAALSCALPVLSGLLFTGGIGENSPLVRRKVIAALPHFGLSMDPAANDATVRGAQGRIDQAHAGAPQVWVIPTDEEGQIACETRQLMLDRA
ncbi:MULTISPECIES: acetate/propionate family kinase [Halomonadaceae]|uniref:acetate/propionate family kinase n=1 Tax=Halomonadaceae TaxID=28256 RepID=UPI00159825BA|nr:MULTISPECIES: acetate kinase [Halomonas]QJQ96149.1 acetate kinase [Halomonas sp. PA5]